MNPEKCPACNSALSVSTNFCGNCGNKVVNEPSSGVFMMSSKPSHGHRRKSSNTLSLTLQIVGGLIVLSWLFSNFHGSSSLNLSEDSPIVSTPSDLPEAARSAITFVGSGGLNEQTESHQLSGNYEIDWQTYGDCSYYASLNGEDIFSAETNTEGTNYIHDLATRNYFVKMITGPAPGCSWSAKFLPIN